jgi:excinuclease ABC subunit A
LNIASILVNEHNLDVIRCADWIIDLGPDGGDKGGKIVVVGTPGSAIHHTLSRSGMCIIYVLMQHSKEILAG